MAGLTLYDTRREFANDPASAAIPGTLKCMLVTSLYTPNINTDEFITSVIANEVSGTNYTARGNACASPTTTMDAAGLVTFDADDPAQWLQNATGFSNARRAIFYWDTGVDATSRLHSYSDDFGADKGNVAGPFSIAIDAAGIHTNAR